MYPVTPLLDYHAVDILTIRHADDVDIA